MTGTYNDDGVSFRTARDHALFDLATSPWKIFTHASGDQCREVRLHNGVEYARYNPEYAAALQSIMKHASLTIEGRDHIYTMSENTYLAVISPALKEASEELKRFDEHVDRMLAATAPAPVVGNIITFPARPAAAQNSTAYANQFAEQQLLNAAWHDTGNGQYTVIILRAYAPNNIGSSVIEYLRETYPGALKHTKYEPGRLVMTLDKSMTETLHERTRDSSSPSRF